MSKQNTNITVICGSIGEIRVNPTGFYTTMEIQLNDAEIDSILDQIDRETIKNYLGGLDQAEPKTKLPKSA